MNHHTAIVNTGGDLKTAHCITSYHNKHAILTHFHTQTDWSIVRKAFLQPLHARRAVPNLLGDTNSFIMAPPMSHTSSYRDLNWWVYQSVQHIQKPVWSRISHQCKQMHGTVGSTVFLLHTINGPFRTVLNCSREGSESAQDQAPHPFLTAHSNRTTLQ